MLARGLWGMPGRRRPRPDDGAVAVEFALILPLLLLIVFGLIQYGFYFWSMQGGSAAAREAARRAAVAQFPDCDDFRDYVEDRIGVTGDLSSAQITRTYSDPFTKLPRTPSAVTVGDVVTITVEFESYDMHIPFVPFINDGLVSQSADSRVEYVTDDVPEVCT